MTPPDDSLPLPARLMMLAGVASTTDAGSIPAGAVVERVT